MCPDKRYNTSSNEYKVREPKTSSLAISALVLSLLPIPLVFCGAVPYFVIHKILPLLVVPLMPIPAIILGCVALIAILRSKRKLRGKAMALTALVISFAWIGIWHTLILAMQGKLKTVNEIKQRAQLASIDTAIELFNSEFNKYPPSDALDEAGLDYCGAMKLAEAIMGRDLLGFHPDSDFRSDGTDGKGKVLYPKSTGVYRHHIMPRKGPYLPLDNANAYSLSDLYGKGNTGPFDPNNFVLCDVFKHVKHRILVKKVGMPILYYKANTSKHSHDVNDPNNPDNIYNYKDNHALLALGIPGKPGVKHPMYEDPKIFYEITKDERVLTGSKPHRPKTYILLSAGQDGLYGTPDDIANFEWKWKRK